VSGDTVGRRARDDDTAPAVILADWGTTALRVWDRFEDGSTVLRVSGQFGLLSSRSPPAVFGDLVRPRADADATPVLVCGMVGSRNGWMEVPYLPCPAALDDLSSALVSVPDVANVHIVPGVAITRSGIPGPGQHDVMRGEETQVLGLVADQRHVSGERLVCLPGTHTKWAVWSSGKLTGFHTVMTGELFGLMQKHSLLGSLMETVEKPDAASGAADSVGFRAGLRRAADPGPLAALLFSVRADALAGTMARHQLAAYLSGILIGRDVREMLALLQPSCPVDVIAAEPLAARYAEALAWFGSQAKLHDSEAVTVAGLAAIATAAGLSRGAPPPWPTRDGR